MQGYLSADILCSEKRIFFSESVARGKLSFQEQIMSKGKHQSIFLPRMETIEFKILQIFFATRAKIEECINNSLCLARKYSRIFSVDIMLNKKKEKLKFGSEKRAVFREQISKKTVSFEEQMSKDKYPKIFWPQI